jgi:hypothetical protein
MTFSFSFYFSQIGIAEKRSTYTCITPYSFSSVAHVWVDQKLGRLQRPRFFLNFLNLSTKQCRKTTVSRRIHLPLEPDLLVSVVETRRQVKHLGMTLFLF